MLLLLFLVIVTVTLAAYEQQAAVTTDAAQPIFSNEGFRSGSQALFVLARPQVRNERMDAQISEMSRVDLVGFPPWVVLRTFEMSRVDLPPNFQMRCILGQQEPIRVQNISDSEKVLSLIMCNEQKHCVCIISDSS